MKERRIVVSIDFGTTYSGVAWAETSRPDVQHVVSDWPSTSSFTNSAKVPTELRKVASGWQWGFQIPESSKRNVADFSRKLDEPHKANKDGETPEELTRLYLSCLHTHFISIMEKRLSPSVVRSTPMDFVVTVPAIWSNAAKEATERAAAMAGFCGNQRIHLISEPEAAALYTLKNMNPSSLQLGKRFVVCDAGGGTVDLITYEVTHVDKLELKEVTEGTGGKCGSSMLNKRFRRHLKQTHGDKHWTDDRLVQAMNEFELFKKTFNPRAEPLTLKVDASLGMRRNRYTMPQEDMKVKIFDPIMKDIVCLIKEQIAMAEDEVTAVVLVGGFGQSKYLRARVRDAIASGTQVLQPESGWVAVVKGAVIHGLAQYGPSMAPVEVASRVARRSYGTCLLTKYDMMRHDAREAFWSEKEEEMVVAEMLWFIRKGQSYPEGRPSIIDYQCDLPVDIHGHRPQTEIEIYCNDEAKPPLHLDDYSRCVATLSLDLGRISNGVKRAAEITQLGYHRYYSLEGAIEAKYESAKITYTVKLGGQYSVPHLVVRSRPNVPDQHPTSASAAILHDAWTTMAHASGPRGLDHGQSYGGPPPSTLAAQLVEDIAPSTKSSTRSDENAELKGFFAKIQRIKDDPQLLKTLGDRVEHNHMLIYVYCRAVLEMIKLDDPFLDRSHVRTEVLKAINFLRFTIKETPSVLAYCADSSAFLYRGQEPLWTWLLPQLLRLLGHPQCLELEGSLEGFLQYMLLVVAGSETLKAVVPHLGLYLRSSLTSILDYLQDGSQIPSRSDKAVNICLPSPMVQAQILGSSWFHDCRDTTYIILRASQALRQSNSLSRIIAYPMISFDPTFQCLSSWAENTNWLLDALMDLRMVQKRWDGGPTGEPLAILEMLGALLDATSHSSAVAKLARRKAYTHMIILCNDIISTQGSLVVIDASGDKVRLGLCTALISIAQIIPEERPMARLSESRLVSELSLLSTQYPAIGEGSDVWRCTELLRQVIARGSLSNLDDTVRPDKFSAEQLKRKLKAFGVVASAIEVAEPPTKKPRLVPYEQDCSRCNDLILGVLNADASVSMESGFDAAFVNAFSQVDESTQCHALDMMSGAMCVTDGTASWDIDEDAPLRVAQCSICEGLAMAQQAQPDTSMWDVWVDTFAKLTKESGFLDSKRPRVVAMQSLRRFAAHYGQGDFFNLETSAAGQWCAQSLNSSVRELRIAAGRTLMAFVGPNPANLRQRDVPPEVFERNRQHVIALLKSMSGAERSTLTETCIMAWGLLGRFAKDEELNLVLIQLMEYLGDSNNVISALAFNELVRLADSLRISPRRLFEPYWKSLAYLATKDMTRRPQTCRSVAELLQLSVGELLLLIQTHALPWLVLEKRKDIVQKIAEARKEDENWRPLMDSPNLAATLSLLLMQETDDLGAFVKSRLSDISPHFHPIPLSELLQAEPVLIVMELLKAAGDSDRSRKALVRKALQTMALAVMNGKESKSKKGNIIGRFLQPYLLGLMARFTDVISDASTSSSVEQRRCIQALEEMLKLSQSHARVARPQISACLLSALPRDALRSAGFACWSTMVLNMEEEDVEALLETTFFIVHRWWPLLDMASKETVRNMLSYLLDSHEVILVKHIAIIPFISVFDELADISARLDKLRPVMSAEEILEAFTRRLRNDISGVVQLGLAELRTYLVNNQASLHASTIVQRSDSVLASLVRALLDCIDKYNGIQPDILRFCIEDLGLIGCLDANQVEAVRERRTIIVLNNFEDAEEVTDFSLFVLQEVLVPAFLSATDTRIQGYLSYAMQELLDRSDIKAACAMQNTGMLGGSEIYRKWIAMPEAVRDVLTPFVTSRYLLVPLPATTTSYPICVPGKPYATWLRSFVMDLLRKGQNPRADIIFEPLTRVIRVKDLSIAEFLLPYLFLHYLHGSRRSKKDSETLLQEIKAVLSQDAWLPHDPYAEREDKKRYFHAIFRILDYCMAWEQKKRSMKLSSADKEGVDFVSAFVQKVPMRMLSERAVQSDDYARALFYHEQYTQDRQSLGAPAGVPYDETERNNLLEGLQHIYANIDEPDGIEGISAHLPAIDINQQIMSQKKAGHWKAAQTWYEMQLAEEPQNTDVQLQLLNCLKRSGQHDVLLNHVSGMQTEPQRLNQVLPYAVEASWVTSRWESLRKYTSLFHGNLMEDFNISIAKIFDTLREDGNSTRALSTLEMVRISLAGTMSTSSTNSFAAAHESMLKCHVLTDLSLIIKADHQEEEGRRRIMDLLDGRLAILGAYYDDKQYLLGVQRAALEICGAKQTSTEVSSLWLQSARLARKSNSLQQSFNAVLHASKLGDDSATIENAKLLWRDNHHRKAIQMLQGAIERNKVMTQTEGTAASVSSTSRLNSQQKLLTARAQLLLAKWLDAAGQTHATALREKYQQPPKTYATWEKGHYYLGRHYKKILEAEKGLSADDQTDNYVTGEIARLVIENYVRSLNSGTKYLYQTLPRVLTLWLDLGAQTDKPPEGKASLSKELRRRRIEQLDCLHQFLDKYIARLPAYVFYTALSQIVARIAHPHPQVFERLSRIIVKVTEAHPRQALWSIIGIMTTRQASERKNRGTQIVQALKSASKRVDGTNYDLKSLLRMGERLAEQLLMACHNGDFQGNKTVHASLTRDLRFNHKCTPCPLAVPVESSLTATLPAVSDHVKKHKAFSRDVVSIDSFLDDVLVLSSLAKPRRLTARGTDGKSYMLLIKPKDDLRTDQRLMEFNGMINRSLKRDAESSRRQLYIRTYAVVPLNEECGIIEWVPGIKTMRDILLNMYSARKIYPDYMALKQLMEEASVSESKLPIFTNDVLRRFPPVLQTWFIHQFPNPSAWFAARLRYTRSCAVMSMVGTILGLGDRHGENVNLEEGNGGVFHVDFNCLFDKGLTFAKPERVPFRLTHNMVAAMGIYGYEGPFRKSSELTLSILRQQEETLMSILEAFIYDPTLDLQKDKRAHRKGDTSVKLQPQSVVDSIKRKVRGLLPNESIPLSVEGQVEELIKQAVDPRNLTAMYIGWCPFL
ncbi:uncharacterized protein F5Z01DRAFT_615130 [Emericellopsis atlantica]|uniref:non-specific serine/threonine protein kinase n=1 Tax=Emericellopsis atlantica TaxID=2614577 RepID=A0A9P8CWK6_9HYPO|nr:uncharacterized protein F5Z01DRAFT_615130 [Emericellopsis atlantica]KAG9258601.1 hypothetical protein F5Z01DRAFT_615130 [Emericellopsis atlantica]